jgi:hypothetical protein
MVLFMKLLEMDWKLSKQDGIYKLDNYADIHNVLNLANGDSRSKSS